MTREVVVKPFKTSLAFYRTRHRTPGCRLSHMLGVPLLILSILNLFTFRKAAAPCFLAGVFFQLLGHKLFEKNEPTLLETRDLMTIPVAAVFAFEQWRDVCEGTWIEKNGLELWRKTPISERVVEEAYSLSGTP